MTILISDYDHFEGLTTDMASCYYLAKQDSYFATPLGEVR